MFDYQYRPSGFNNWRELALHYRRMEGYKAVGKMIRSGELRPANTYKCVDCGKQAFCFDHRDYRKPKMVDPVCKKCDCARGEGKPRVPINSQKYWTLLRQAVIWYLQKELRAEARKKRNLRKSRKPKPYVDTAAHNR
jgi:hypothetical protein